MSDGRERWREELQATSDCIALEDLGNARTAREREHLVSCPRCQSELALFESFQQDHASEEEARDNQWIAEELTRRNAPSNVTTFRPRMRPLHGLAAAAAAVIVIGTAFWYERREPSIETNIRIDAPYRTSRLELITPQGELTEAPRMLQWSSIPDADRYTIRILEVDRTLLWTAETPQTRLVLPAEAIARFAPGKTLLWDVSAHNGSNEIATSGTQSVRVIVNSPGRSNP